MQFLGQHVGNQVRADGGGYKRENKEEQVGAVFHLVKQSTADFAFFVQ